MQRPVYQRHRFPSKIIHQAPLAGSSISVVSLLAEGRVRIRHIGNVASIGSFVAKWKIPPRSLETSKDGLQGGIRAEVSHQLKVGYDSLRRQVKEKPTVTCSTGKFEEGP